MSNTKIKLISPDRLKETCQTAGRLCFICQIEKKILPNLSSKKVELIFLYFFTIFHNFKRSIRAYWAGVVRIEGIMTEFFYNFRIT